MEELTQQQIAKQVAAAFDSVNLINKLDGIEILTNDEIDTYNRNVEHLKIMMGKEWFIKALTTSQKTKINNLINKS